MNTQTDSISLSTVGTEFYSLLDAVDSEFIADDFEIGTHTTKHDFDNHLKVDIFEGVNPSDSLAELAEKTAIYDELSYMAGSTFSRLTNDCDYRAVVRLFLELLHSPPLSHQRGVQRKRLDWLDRAVVATDATNLNLTRSVAVPSKRHDTEILRVIDPGEKGLHLNLSARVDGDAKHLFGVTITPGVMREPTQSSISRATSRSAKTSTRQSTSLTVVTLIMTGSVNSKSVKRTSSVSSKQMLASTSWNTSRTSRLPTSRGHDISVMIGLSLPRLQTIPPYRLRRC